MTESIVIRNFGPINEIEIADIKPFTVFVGRSGIGKSTIIKVTALFRWIFKRASLRAYLRLSNVTASPFKFDFREYLKNGGMESYLKPDTEIVYQMGDCTITYSTSSGLSVGSIPNWDGISLEKICFITDKRNILPDLTSGGTTISIANFYLTELLKDYLDAVEKVNHLALPYLNIDFEANPNAPKTRRYMISGHDANGEYRIKLQDASSGTQTVVPLSVIVEYYALRYDFVKVFNQSVIKALSESDSLANFNGSRNVGDLPNRRVNFHIEEPELSLYPESQVQLIDSMAKTIDLPEREYSVGFAIATHSPYVINHMNLLARRHATEAPGAKLPFSSMAVYEIIDGYLNNLAVEERQIFDTSLLSDPIDTIYTEFNSL